MGVALAAGGAWQALLILAFLAAVLWAEEIAQAAAKALGTALGAVRERARQRRELNLKRLEVEAALARRARPVPCAHRHPEDVRDLAGTAWRDDPDDARPLFPAGPCECGRDLTDAADLGVSGARQVIEMPLAAAKVVQYDSHAVACACGRVHEAPPPADAGEAGTVTWGLNARALAVFLMVIHHVPVERCAGILESLSGIRPSDGFVHALLDRAARAVRGVNMLIRALIITAGVICADETPIRVGPGPKTRKRYLLVACTNLLTCYFLGDRTLASFDGFVFPDLSGTIVHDRYQNYDAFSAARHQLCCAHVLRDLEDCAESYPGAIWPGQAADALRTLVHAANEARDQGLTAVPDDKIAADLRLFRSAVLVGLQEVRRVPGAKARQKPGRTLLECLRDREADILRFLGDLRIPPTSNQAERDLRRRRPSRKSPDGSARRKPPATATPSAATHLPPSSTAATPSPPSATPSQETPGCHPSRKLPEPRLPAVTQSNQT